LKRGNKSMKEFWIKVNPDLSREKKKNLIAETSEVCKAYIVNPKDVGLARESGAKVIVSPSPESDILLVESLADLEKAKNEGKKTCISLTVKSKGDERKVIEAAKLSSDYIVALFQDWKVIPLENLIAEIGGRSTLIAVAKDAQEAKLALETLEIGAGGVAADTPDADEAMRIYKVLKEVEASEKLRLETAEIVEVKPLGVGARACIDTCDLMNEGEGLLVGCQSSGFFLVEAEVHETPFVQPRPFRVNAGSIALYVIAPGGRTKYLSELKAGEEVLIVDRHGRSRTAHICRVKIEWRPLILIEAECNGRRVKTILQNAETIRVVTEDGSISLKDLKKGDKVLVHLEKGGRHFGALVEEERIIEV